MSRQSARKNSAKNKSVYNGKKFFLAIVICIAVILVIFLGNVVKQLTYNKVYNGVYIENTDISCLTREELVAKIPDLFDRRLSKTITLNIDNSEYSFDTLFLSPAIDAEKMADTAFNYGRNKGVFGRLKEIKALKKENVKIPFMLCLDESELQKIIDKATENLDITATPNEIDFGNDSLIITRGKSGNGVAFSQVKKAVENCILSDSTLAKADFKYIEPEEITYDYVMRYVSKKPVEATYSVENHRIKYTESQPGVSLSKSDLENAIKKATGSTITVPAKITQPKLTSEELNKTLLCDELGSFKSDFSSSSRDRAYNVKLACEKINGYVLSPGEEFSYNAVVGPRTAERGFRIANVYVGNTTQPGIGGGICQVSSTMYNAVVFADLEVTARKNHTMPVAYVPIGRDATVSYGAIDFKFKNTTDMPVQIIATAENGINVVKIIGTDKNPQREIKIVTEKTGTSGPKVVIEKSAELYEGEIKIESEGTNGSSHIAYKVVYENGKEISKTLLSKSVYKGKDRVEIHGTKKKEELPAENEQTENSETTPQETPVPSEVNQTQENEVFTE